LQITIDNINEKHIPDNSKYLAEIQHIQLDLERAKVDISQLTNDRQELEKRIQEYKTEIARLTEIVNKGGEIEIVKNLNKQIAQLQSENDKLLKEVADYKTLNARLRNGTITLEVHEKTLLSKDNKIEKLQSEISTTKAENQELKTKIANIKPKKNVALWLIIAALATAVLILGIKLGNVPKCEDYPEPDYSYYEEQIQELQKRNKALEKTIEDM
jgi:cell division protein FtsB